jgi:hypothetical protein
MERFANPQTATSDGVPAAPELSALPGFAAGDVAANIAGRLSDTQKGFLRVQVRNRALSAAVVLGVSVINWMNGADFLWLAILGIAVTIAIYQLATSIAEMANPVVSSLEGDASIEIDGDRSCFVRIGGKKLGLSKKASGILVSGGPYRVFFLERANLLVGAEISPVWRAIPQKAGKRRFPISIGIG